MHKSAHTVLNISNGCMMFAAYLALVTTDNYGPMTLWLPIAIFAVAPALVWLDARTQLYRFVTSFVTLCVAFFLAGMFLVNAAELIHIVTWLVIYIQTYKMCHRKTPGDYYRIYLMSFFLLVSACAQEPEPSFGLALALFLLSAVWAMMMLHIYSETIANRTQPSPDIVPAGGRGPVVPQRGQLVMDRNLVGSVAGLSAGCLLLTVLLFVSTPRMEAGIFGGTNTIQARTDVDAGVDLTMGGQISEDSTLVMRVRFPDEPGGQFGGELFWRSTPLSDYRGARWERAAWRDNAFHDESGVSDLDNAQDGKIIARTVPPDTQTVRQDIFLDHEEIEILPVLAFVHEVNTKAGILRWDSTGDLTVIISNLKQSSVTYEALSDVAIPDASELRAASSNYRLALRRQFEPLTRHDLLLQTVRLAESLTADAETPYDKVLAIQNYFLSGQFGYTLDVPILNARNPVDDFILNVKNGHCELYASSMALMLRSLGIPTRVVTGYRGGEWSGQDEAYLVRKNMAHLWVEVYFVDHGWVTFDPSPPSNETDLAPLERISRAIGLYMLNAKLLWYRDVIGFEGGIQWERLRDALRDAVRLDFEFLSRGSRGGASITGVVVPVFVIGLVALGLLGWFAFLVVSYIRRRSVLAGPGMLSQDQRRARRVYLRLKRQLSKHGTDCSGKTSREILEAIAERGALEAGPVRNIVQTYNRVRFGGHPLSQAEYTRLVGVVRRIRPAAR